jgi:hypothetical protein
MASGPNYMLLMLACSHNSDMLTITMNMLSLQSLTYSLLMICHTWSCHSDILAPTAPSLSLYREQDSRGISGSAGWGQTDCFGSKVGVEALVSL